MPKQKRRVKIKALRELECVGCGCDQDHACQGGCEWVAVDICSACVEKAIRILSRLRRGH